MNWRTGGGDETKAHLYLMSKVSSSVIKHHPSQMTAPLVLLQRQFLMHTKISPPEGNFTPRCRVAFTNPCFLFGFVRPFLWKFSLQQRKRSTKASKFLHNGVEQLMTFANLDTFTSRNVGPQRADWWIVCTGNVSANQRTQLSTQWEQIQCEQQRPQN